VEGLRKAVSQYHAWYDPSMWPVVYLHEAEAEARDTEHTEWKRKRKRELVTPW
jgi:hypothetical protein